MSPRQAITQFMADALRAQSLFKSVTFHERGTEPAYVLTGNIERLEEVDQGRDVRAVCTISAQLMEAQTGSVVWNGTASEAVPVDTRNVAGVVSSLSAAAQTSRRSPDCIRRERTEIAAGAVHRRPMTWSPELGIGNRPAPTGSRKTHHLPAQTPDFGAAPS